MHRAFAPLFCVILSACGGQTTPADGIGGGADAGLAEAALPAPTLADLVSVREIAFFQATKVSLVRDGAKSVPNAPVVAKRPGMLRVYVALDGRWRSHDAVAELKLKAGDKELATLTDRKTLASSSTDEALDSTFTFQLEAETVTPDLQYALTIREEVVRDAGEVRYPAEGLDSFGARTGAEQIRLRFVPIRYDADGSGTLPDTSDSTIATYRDAIYKWYPTAKVEIEVRDPMPWSTAINADGTGWDDLLNGIADLRAADMAPADVYYVADFKPPVSLGKYCGKGCVLGVAPQAGPTAVSARIAAIIGTGRSSGSTLAQELAHAMGRGHAPCGDPDRPDRKFPYSDGSIGVWGWDILEKTLVDPQEYSDIMSYCQPVWVSDYTFKGLFDRIVTVNAAVMTTPPSGTGFKSMRLGRVTADGTVRWGNTFTSSASGQQKHAVFRDAKGVATPAIVEFYPYDNIPGGMLLVDDSTPRFSSVVIGDASP